MAKWRFVYTDLDYRPIGEILNAAGRKVELGLNKIPSASFTIRMDNPLAADIILAEGYVKIYRGSTLVFFGPVISVEESATDGQTTLSVQAAGAAWFLTKRLAGKSVTGTKFTTLTDKAQIAKSLIDTTNTESETGISTTGATISAGSTSIYTAGPYRPVSDCINELANTLDGFDWEVAPIEPTALDDATGKIGVFHAEALFGTTRSEAIFEFGTGRTNITTYTYQLDRTTQANAVHHVKSGNTEPKTQTDSSSESKWKRLEDLAQAEIVDPELRDKLLQAHIDVRKGPRKTITFTPHIQDARTPGRVPQFLVDYGLGDIVRARATIRNAVRFDALLRVWAVSVGITDVGLEQLQLTLSDQGT